MQHLASSGNQLWALQWHSFLPAGLSAGSWGRAASCLTWRAPSGGLSGAEFPSSLCHLLFPWLVPSLFCRWGRQIAPIPDSCFLHGFCSWNVSLSFHVLFFSLPILSLKQTFFFFQCSVCQEHLLLWQRVLMDVGVSAFCKMHSTLFCFSVWLSSHLFWSTFCLFFSAFSLTCHLPEEKILLLWHRWLGWLNWSLGAE